MSPTLACGTSDFLFHLKLTSPSSLLPRILPSPPSSLSLPSLLPSPHSSLSLPSLLPSPYLLFPLPRHCKHLKNEILLQELITAVGYFCVLNVQNQVSAAGRSWSGESYAVSASCGHSWSYVRYRLWATVVWSSAPSSHSSPL